MKSPTEGHRGGMAAWGLSTLLALSGAAWAEPTTPATPAAEDRDDRLERQIEKAIENDKTLTAQGLDVQVIDGKATLTGTTPTQADRQRAGKLADVAGVKEVDNQIVVRVTESPPAAKPVSAPAGKRGKK